MCGFKSSIHFWLITCLFLMCPTGCRMPKLFLTPPATSLYYDTAFEQELMGKIEPARDSLEYDFKWRYRNTLAEPVTLVDYKKDVSSTWQILFATNREPQVHQTTQTVSYRNRFSETLRYGSCKVQLTVPTQRELKDARPDGFFGELLDLLPHPWQYEVIFDEEKFTTVEQVAPLRTTVFYQRLNAQVAASREQDVLIFVHGFNVDFESSVSRLAQIARDMPFNGAVVAYSWPSQGGVENYERDGDVVDESIEPFMQFLEEMKANLPAETRVNLVVHSMGNRLAMRSISRLMSREIDPPQRFENVVLCAPDVGVSEFKRLGSSVIDSSKHTTLYRCLNDSALIASSYRNGEERAGGSYAPVIMEGLDTVECAVIDTSILGHSYYGSNPHMLRDLFCILKEAQSAAERPWMKKQPIPFQGDMWIIADWPLKLEWDWHLNDNQYGILQAGFTHEESNPGTPSAQNPGKIELSNGTLSVGANVRSYQFRQTD